LLARLHIGRKGLAALFDQARDVGCEALDIDATRLGDDRSIRQFVHCLAQTLPQAQMAPAVFPRKVAVVRRSIGTRYIGQLWTLTAHSFILALVILDR
jgi:hypothetical protein